MRIKLILTGGGTRGIYQIGAMRALEEIGLMQHVVSISGCSIGAVNAALSLNYPMEEAKEIWKNFVNNEVFKNIDQYSKSYLMQLCKEYLNPTEGIGINIDPMITYLKYVLDEDKIRASNKELIISCFNMTSQKLEYRSLDNITEGLLGDYILGSARIPFFRPIHIEGSKYVDGGVADNEPRYSILEEKKFDMIITIRIAYITRYLLVNRINNVSSENDIVIKPSSRLGTPINFTKPTFKEKYEMGYNDAISYFKTKPHLFQL